MSKKLEAILATHGVETRSSGQSEILVHCPLCGSADQGQHLSISMTGRGWRCLRNPAQHKGRSYAKILSLVLSIPIERARELVGERAYISLPDADEFSSSWRKSLGVEEPSRPKSLSLLKEFRPLDFEHRTRHSDVFWNYLYDRGYNKAQAAWAASSYNLHYAIAGQYAYRIVIPIESAQGKLMTWTARSVDPKADVRYLTLKKDYAVEPPGNLILGLPLLHRAAPTKCLTICEGPFDAIAVSTLGHAHGIWGACLFGLELSAHQADLLSELEGRFEQMRLLLDPDASLRTLNLRSRLPRRCRVARLPSGYKDPGQLIERKEGRDIVMALAA